MRGLLDRTWDENILFSALIELTYRCNLDCYFCYNDLSVRGTALSDDQYRQLFDDLAELQVMNLSFTGGEPLAHPSFLELGSMARERGFVVRIKSNGHALRGALARQIRDRIDPFLIETSLHGACAESHDRQTRVAGSFDQLMANLGELKSLGLRVKLNATLTRWNEHEVDAMMSLADGLELPMSITPTVTPRDDGDTGPLAIAASDEGIRNLYRALDRRIPDSAETGSDAPEVSKNCGAGASGIAVDPFGNVYPCVQWRRPLGNLHQASVIDIWQGSSQLDEVRQINEQAGEQTRAHGGLGFSHCMGLSEEKTGDPLAIDPMVERNARLLQEVRAERSPSGRAHSALPVLQ